MSNIRLEIRSEEAVFDRPAQVLVYDGDRLVAGVTARVELKKGADGGRYPCVTIEEVTPEFLLKQGVAAATS